MKDRDDVAAANQRARLGFCAQHEALFYVLAGLFDNGGSKVEFEELFESIVKFLACQVRNGSF